MKSIRLVLLFCIIGVVAEADEDPWLKPPDGYVWPNEAVTKLEGDTELSVSDMPEKVRRYLSDKYAPQSPPSKVYVRRADLNDDGVLEWFIDRPELGGTGGGIYDIVDVSGKIARNVGGIQGGFHLCVAATKDRWLRIEGSSKAGGGHFTRYLLQFKDGKYITVRNEDHDLINNKITLRK